MITGMHPYCVEIVQKLEAQIARLEDLRRWRPMTEFPADERRVLVRLRENHDWFEAWHRSAGSWRVGSYVLGDGSSHADQEWTYIPGQEPEGDSHG